jgi:hypothetical protein
MNTYQKKGRKREREREREKKKSQQKESNDFSIEHHSDCNITKESIHHHHHHHHLEVF